MSKQNKEIKQAIKFEYELGSNVIKVNGETKYLDIVVWDKVTFEEVESHICK